MRLMEQIRTRRFLRDAATVVGIIIIVFVWWLLTFNDYQHDARAYWNLDLDAPYVSSVVGGREAYLYSPAFAQLVWPLTLVPWEVFAGVWAALNLGALVWLAGPIIGAGLLVIPGSPVIDEVGTGNIHLLMAGAIYAGFRWPGAWAFVILTKVAPGAGLLYFAGARRWRALAIGAGLTLAISAASFLTAPGLWFDWIETLRNSTDVAIPSEIAIIPGPIWARTLAASVLALVGGLVGWRWLVPVAATLALPVPWSSGLSVLVAVIALWRSGMLTEQRATAS